MRRKKYDAVGITCGIGSMLLGARMSGFKPVGNIEWRRYYHLEDEQGRNTFKENFRNAFFVHKLEDLTDEQHALATGCALAMGHPECGNFSQLNQSNRSRVNDPADIPLFVDLVADLRPRFFVMDDLPKSFIAYSMERYAERLQDYDLFPEWISNYHYGNVQKNRRRLFMIGALKDERFTFIPGEFAHDVTVASLIGDLHGQEGSPLVHNHERHVLKERSGKGQHLLERGHHATWREVQRFFKDKHGGCVIPYVASDGSIKTRPGTYKGHWEGHAHVMDGGSPAIHALRCLPYTIRERARIQGFPDDFEFFGTKLDRYGRWNHDQNIHMVKQTGKAMPVQFNAYVARLIRATMERNVMRMKNLTWQRFNKQDSNVDRAKRWFCDNVGYRDQPRACAACWLRYECDSPAFVQKVPRNFGTAIVGDKLL